MRGLRVALGFLTRLPVAPAQPGPGDLAGALRAFPVAGLIVGALLAGAGRAGAALDPWLGALAALGLWLWITGALHLDGLGDVADALGAAHGAGHSAGHGDRARLLAVMADPHLGSFGATAIALQLLAKLVLLRLTLPDGWPLLIGIPAAARAGPLLWAWWLPPLKPGGLGAALAGAARARDRIGWGAVLAAGAVAQPPLAAAFALLPGFALWVRRRLGGVTGDVHGAGIELVETGLLLAGAIWARL